MSILSPTIRFAVATIASAALLRGVGGSAYGAQPNLVLITIDTVRADRMGFLGSKRGLTPNLDALARDAVVFRLAYAQAPLTPTSHATILTGTYPQFHGVADFGMPISPRAVTLAEVLGAHGYRTAAFVGSIILDPYSGLAPGFERGFQHFEAGFRLGRPGRESRYETVERRAGEVVSRAIAWLQKDSRPPFFLWVHLYDPHDPYDPPPPYSKRFASSPYDGEIAYADSALAKLFQELKSRGLYDDSLIAVMGDHGEAFGEHGEKNHGIFLYNETIQVPFVLKLPGERFAGKSVDAAVELVDFAPTALAVLQLAPPSSVQGTSLFSLIEGKSHHRQPAYSQTDYPRRAFGWSSLQALRSSKYLFVNAPRSELYDLAADPEEKTNLVDKNSAVAAQLRTDLESVRARFSAKGTAARAPLGPEELEKLRSLGYVSYSEGTQDSASGTTDPKDKIEVANAVHAGILAGELGRTEEAMAAFRGIVKDDPQIYVAQYQLGLNLMRAKNYAQAVAPLQKAAALRPDAGNAHYQLGVALYNLGRLPESASQFEKVVGLSPKWAEAHYSLASVYARTDRVPEAVRELHSALELDPQLFNAHLLLGRILTLENHIAEAVPHLERAVALQPENAEAHSFLAEAYSRAGRASEADRERALAERLNRSRP